MSERFPDEVLQRAIAAYLPEKLEADAIAAMRAVLEGHDASEYERGRQAVLAEINEAVRQLDAYDE